MDSYSDVVVTTRPRVTRLLLYINVVCSHAVLRRKNTRSARNNNNDNNDDGWRRTGRTGRRRRAGNVVSAKEVGGRGTEEFVSCRGFNYNGVFVASAQLRGPCKVDGNKVFICAPPLRCVYVFVRRYIPLPRLLPAPRSWPPGELPAQSATRG